MRISADERARVNAAIAEAEAACPLEFVCVLARNASAYEFFPLAWSALVALLVPWPLLLATEWPFGTILLAQLVVFAVTLLVLSIPAVRFHLVPRRMQRSAAHRAATEQFFIRGLARTPDRCGVLLFVSHEERYARVLADDGASAILKAEDWREVVDHLVTGAQRGHHAGGFVAALERCGQKAGALRAGHGAKTNELPDRFVILD